MLIQMCTVSSPQYLRSPFSRGRYSFARRNTLRIAKAAHASVAFVAAVCLAVASASIAPAYNYTTTSTLSPGATVSGFGLTLQSVNGSRPIGRVTWTFTGPSKPSTAYYSTTTNSIYAWYGGNIRVDGYNQFGSYTAGTGLGYDIYTGYQSSIHGKLLFDGGGINSAGIGGDLISLDGGPITVTISLSFGGTSQSPESYRKDSYDDETGSTVYVPEDSGQATADEGPAVANSTTGAYLTAAEMTTPVVAEHGYSDFIWASVTPHAVAGPSAWKAAYFFGSDVPFTQFIVPEALPGGDAQFNIIFGNHESHPIQAGTPFDFTQFAPGGVSAFILTGFDATENLAPDQTFPYTHGFRFATEGTANIRSAPFHVGDYTLGGLVNADDYTAWRANYGATSDNQADGNNDGIVDASDYLIWRKAAAATASPAAGLSTNVPEPATIILFLAAFAGTCPYRFRRHRTDSSFGSWHRCFPGVEKGSELFMAPPPILLGPFTCSSKYAIGNLLQTLF